MPEHSRAADYLRLHANVARRVSNLETGVHPVNANVDYFDSTDWANVTITNTNFQHASSGIIEMTWQWRKRIGIISMIGGVQEDDAGAFAAIGAGGVKIGELPAAARPTRDLTLPVILDVSPYRTRARIKTDGDVILFNDPAVSSSDPILFDGSTWTTG